MCRIERWSVRTLRERIDSHALRAHGPVQKPEDLIRQELAGSARRKSDVAPTWCSKTPMCSTSWGCTTATCEKDLEDAILRELETLPAGAGRGLRLRRAPEAHPARRRRFLHRPAVLSTASCAAWSPIDLKLGDFKRRVQGPDGAVPALAGRARPEPGEHAAARHHPVHRQETGADRAAGTGQGRHPRRRVPDRAAAARRASPAEIQQRQLAMAQARVRGLDSTRPDE